MTWYDNRPIPLSADELYVEDVPDWDELNLDQEPWAPRRGPLRPVFAEFQDGDDEYNRRVYLDVQRREKSIVPCPTCRQLVKRDRMHEHRARCDKFVEVMA